MDTVFIKGLLASTTIGVYSHERKIQQDLIIDLELNYDSRKACRSDSFEDALDYDAISCRVKAFVEETKYYLIEAVAEHLSSALLEEFPITKLKMKITKPGAIKIAKEVGIIIQRSGRNR